MIYLENTTDLQTFLLPTSLKGAPSQGGLSMTSSGHELMSARVTFAVLSYAGGYLRCTAELSAPMTPGEYRIRCHDQGKVVSDVLCHVGDVPDARPVPQTGNGAQYIQYDYDTHGTI